MELYDFGLSVASYRVRIALNLKGLAYHRVPVSLTKSGGEQHAAEYRALNPQGLLPTLVDDDFVLTQSLAIIEYLDETRPEPALLPATPKERARARQLAHIMVSDTHPLLNLRVLAYMRATMQQDEVTRSKWFRNWLTDGLDALELWLTADYRHMRYCLGEEITLPDVCLVPLMYAARRFSLAVDDFPRLCKIEAECLRLDAFANAAPEHAVLAS